MGACSSKPKVRGDDDEPTPIQDPTSPAPRNPVRSRSNPTTGRSPAQDQNPTSPVPRNPVRSKSNPPAGRSPAKNPSSPSTVATGDPPGTTRVKESGEENAPVSKDSTKNDNAQLERRKQEPTPSGNSQSKPTEPEAMETNVESMKPEPTTGRVESKQEAPKSAPPEKPSKEAEMKLLDSEIKLLESATRTLSKKPEQGGISIVPNHTPNASETKLLASLATPKSETSNEEPEIKLPVPETKATPELVKEEVPPDKKTEHPRPENGLREIENVSDSTTRKDSDPETMTEMSNVSSRQPSLDFLDASDKMVVDKGVLESMPDTMKAKLEKAVLEPIVSSKTVSDWNAKVEKAMEEPDKDEMTETKLSHEKVDNEEDTRVPTTVETKGHEPERVS